MLIALGKIPVTTPGTPVRITANQADPARVLSVNSVMIEALVGNTGHIYIGIAKTMSTSTLTGVLAVLSPSTANSIPAFTASLPYSPGGVDAQDIWIDADNAGEGVLASAVVG